LNTVGKKREPETMDIAQLHPWNLDYEQARAVQERLGRRVSLRPLPLGKIAYVAGSDVAVSRKLDLLVAAVVVVSFPDLEVQEMRTAALRPRFPYVPGYLSFRELPVLARCLRRVRTPFQAMLCDGQGIAHPRGLGLAAHLGLALGIPTVGCAKSRLIGDHGEVGTRRGDFEPLTLDGRRIGSVLRTRRSVKPIFVSPGHLVDHPGSRRITLACLTRYRLPEPTRLAHIAAGEEKRKREAIEAGV
jgi:deoxyribonuclease V